MQNIFGQCRQIYTENTLQAKTLFGRRQSTGVPQAAGTKPVRHFNFFDRPCPQIIATPPDLKITLAATLLLLLFCQQFPLVTATKVKITMSPMQKMATFDYNLKILE
jgi:hypothetical protein